MMNYLRSGNGGQSFPLSVALEGRSWVLTALVESTIALWMILLRDERAGFLQSRACVGGQWTQEILTYLFFMAVGALSAGFAIGVLSLNLRPPTLVDWRLRSCRSTFALVILDLLALDHVVFVLLEIKERIYNKQDENFGRFVGETFITVAGVGCTIAFNVLYVREFGFCISCRGKEHGNELVEKAQDWLTSKRDLPVAEVEESPPKTEEIVGPEPEKDQSRKISNGDSSVSGNSFFEDEGSSLQKGSISQAQLLQRWDTKKLIELGSIKLSKHKSLAIPFERKFEVIVESTSQNGTVNNEWRSV